MRFALGDLVVLHDSAYSHWIKVTLIEHMSSSGMIYVPGGTLAIYVSQGAKKPGSYVMLPSGQLGWVFACELGVL